MAYEGRIAARDNVNVNVVSIAGVVDTDHAASPELVGMAEVGASYSSSSGEATYITILDDGSDSMYLVVIMTTYSLG